MAKKENEEDEEVHTLAEWENLSGFGFIDPKRRKMTKTQYFAWAKAQGRKERLNEMLGGLDRIGKFVTHNFGQISGFEGGADNPITTIGQKAQQMEASSGMGFQHPSSSQSVTKKRARNKKPKR